MYLTLDEYYLLARRIIVRHAVDKRRWLNDDECLSTIVDYAIKADNSFDGVTGTRAGRRALYAKYGLLTYIRDSKRRAVPQRITDSMAFSCRRPVTNMKLRDKQLIDMEIEEIHSFLDKNTDVSQRDKEIFLMYSTGDVIYDEIGVKYGMTKQNVSLIVNRVMNKLKEHFHE